MTSTAAMNDSPRLKIRIPKRAWNAYDPQAELPPRRVTRGTTRTASTPTTGHPLSSKQSKKKKKKNDLSSPSTSPVRTSSHPRSCKAKLWTFHHGGPKRVTKGVSQNEVTYEEPCLQPTCANCWKWHPHLVRERTLTDHPSDGVVSEQPGTNIHSTKPEVEPLSPEIDPRILDGTWQLHQSRRSSVMSMGSNSMNNTPVLTPVKTSFASDFEHVIHPSPTHDDSSAPSNQLYNVYFPTALVKQSVTTAPSQTRWRHAPRNRYTAHISFASHEGKGKFKALIVQRERKTRRQEYDRAYRARKLAKGKAGRVSGPVTHGGRQDVSVRSTE